MSSGILHDYKTHSTPPLRSQTQQWSLILSAYNTICLTRRPMSFANLTYYVIQSSNPLYQVMWQSGSQSCWSFTETSSLIRPGQVVFYQLINASSSALPPSSHLPILPLIIIPPISSCLSSSDLLLVIPITRNTFVDKESINPLPYLAFQTHSQKQAQL